MPDKTPYVAKLLDPAGRFCCSQGFVYKLDAARQAKLWSMGGGVAYFMNGNLRTIYKGGVRIFPARSANLQPATQATMRNLPPNPNPQFTTI